MPTVIAETTRGGIVESVHHGVVAVVDVDGRLVAAAGDPERVVFYRSSAKPFQAIPLVESGAADRFGFTPAELALCCASHHGETGQQAQVAAMLAKLDLGPEHLRCGVRRPADKAAAALVTCGEADPSPLACDCSGKHTGMLAACLQLGLPIETYLEPTHPLQERILALMAEVLRVPEEGIVLGTDGCSLPTFGAPMRAFAASWATLAAPERAPSGAGREHAAALRRLRQAMLAHPENVAGQGGLDTDLMALGGGQVVAKGGAEGMLCLALPERGLGIAIRVLDGSYRALREVAVETLRQLEAVAPAYLAAVVERDPPALRNHNGWHVGEIRAALALR